MRRHEEVCVVNEPPAFPSASDPAENVDFYALLRLRPDASKLDIINAYRRAKLTFRKDSLAVYSLYSEADLELIRRQIETAYEVLTDRDKRARYDAKHGFAGVSRQGGAPEGGVKAGSVKARDVKVGRNDATDNVVPLRASPERAQYNPELERRIRTATEYQGVFLREVREYRGISLRDVAEHTRISLSYLQAIEAEDVSCFPATAYLKGYLGQYAAEIGLEPHRVVQGYPPLAGKE